MTIPGFIAAEYDAVSPLISAQQAINTFPEIGSTSANPLSFVGVPGTVEVHDFGSAVRGMYSAWGQLYVVAGTELYRINSAHTVTEIGSVANNNLPVDMTHNRDELLVISAKRGYVTDKNSTTLTGTTDPDFPQTISADFIDGYGVLVEFDSGRFWHTAITDFDSVLGTDVATAERSPDNLKAVLVDHREVWLFGEDTIEVWFNSGDSANVFQPQSLIERGVYGTYVPAKLDNTVFWIGEDGVVYKAADAFNPLRVSHHGIEALIRKTTTDPICFSYEQDGHAFYQINFPGEITLVYDAATQLWHRRKTRGREDCVYHFHARAYGREYVGGANGKLYYLDPNTYSHEGELERIRTFGPLRSRQYFTQMPRLYALFETGENSNAVDLSKVFLEVSDDGGRTYGSRIEAGIGKRGDYAQEVAFYGLGGFYDGERVLRLTMTDDARYALVDVHL